MAASIVDFLNLVYGSREKVEISVPDSNGELVKCSGVVDALVKIVEPSIDKDSDFYRETFKPWQKRFIDEL